NLLIAGSFQSTVDFNPGAAINSLTSAGNLDAFLLKLDTNGNYLSARQFGGVNEDAATALTYDSSGSIYVAGYFNGTAEFNVGGTSNSRVSSGAEDAFVVRVEAANTVKWVATVSGTGLDQAYGVGIDSNKNVTLAGRFTASTDVDPGAAQVLLNGNGAFLVQLQQPIPNTPPTLASISNQTVNEGSALTVTVAATDPDAGQSLTFTLAAGAPAGATINSSTGVFTWTPSENQGGATYPVTVQVADNGTGNLRDSKTFTITVDEVNQAPVLTPMSDQSVFEGVQLQLTMHGTDADLPSQALSYSLLGGAPSGASIDPVTGVFTWRPTEAQGPGTFNVSVRVTDNGSPPLSDTKTFQIAVKEANQAPVLATIGNQAVPLGADLNLTLSATDADLPANVLTYGLEAGGPSGITLNATTGAFHWTAGTAGTFTVTVKVTDNGSPAASDIQSFSIVVNAPPTLTNISDQVSNEDVPVGPIAFEVGDAETAPENLVVTATSSNQTLVPNGRLQFNAPAANRTLSFVPAVNQFGTTTITVTVRDTGSDGIAGNSDDSMTLQSFLVTVNAVNHAPTAVSLTNTVATLPENTSTASHIRLGDVAVTDDALGSNILSLSGSDVGAFELISSVLYLKAGTILNFEAKAAYQVSINVDDSSIGATPDASTTYNLAITDINEAPTAVTLTNIVSTLSENTSTATRVRVADLGVIDDALGTNVFSLSGPDATAFELVGNALYLRAGTELDFESKVAYQLIVNVDDSSVGGTPDASIPYTLTITDFNDPPTAVTLINAVLSLAENVSTASHIRLGDVGVTDDALGTNVFSLSGPDAPAFELLGGSLYLKAGTTLNFEAKSTYQVTVTVDDSSVGSTPDASLNYSLAITDINEAPTAVGLTNTVSSITKNTSTASHIRLADIAVTDDALGTNVLSLSGPDALTFEIIGSVLYLKAGTVLNIDAQPIYQVSIHVDDSSVGGTPDASIPYTLTITEFNDPPTAVTLTNAVLSLAENMSTASHIRLADVGVTDDALGTNVFSLSGPDAPSFELLGGSLYLKAGTILNFEAKTTYQVTINVDDSSVGSTPDASLNYSLAITDVNEAPTAVGLTNTVSSIAGNTSTVSHIRLADIAVIDDALGTNVLSLSGPDALTFEIIGSVLYLKAGTVLNIDLQPFYHVTINVDDSSVGSTPDASINYTLSISNFNHAPTAVILTNLVSSIAENTSITSHVRVADVGIADDGLGTNVLSLNGPDAPAFELLGGALYLKAGTILNFEAKSTYQVTINVDDSSVGSTPDASFNYSLTITDINEAPTAVSLTNIVSTLAENTSTANRILLTNVGVTDDALGTNVFSLSGPDATAFELLGGGLYLKAGTTLNAEVKATYQVTVNVDDSSVGTTPDASNSFTLSISDVNTAPTAVTLTNKVSALAENVSTTNRIRIADVGVIDDALGTNAFSLSGPDAPAFELLGGSLYLKAGTILNFEAKTMYQVTINVDDSSVGSTPDANLNYSLAITDINEAPTAVALNNVLSTLAENANTAFHIQLADIRVTDDALGTNGISLNGPDAADFEVSNGALFLKAGTALNFETQSSYQLTINVDDNSLGLTPDVSSSYTLTLTDVNESPTAVIFTNTVSTLLENTSTATRIRLADIAIVDDALGTNTVSLSGVDGADFELMDSSLYLKAGTVLNFESQASYQVRVNVDDSNVGGTPDASSLYTLTVNDINEAPTAVILTNLVSTLAENTSTTNDFRVADVSIVDDASGVNVISLSGPDATAFELIGGIVYLKAGTVLDFESKASYQVNVKVDDSSVGSSPDASITYTLNVGDINEAPSAIVLTNSTSTLADNTNTTSRVRLADIGAVDDALGTNVYSLSGPVALSFELTNGGLYLKAGAVLNVGAKSVYQVTINVDDSSVGSTPDATRNYTLNIVDLNEAPTDLNLSSTSIAENRAGGSTVGTFAAVDPDQGDSFTYTLVPGSGSSDNGSFIITNGQLQTTQSLDFETQNTFTIRVRTTDQGGLAFEKPFTIRVTDVNEAPTMTSFSSQIIQEDNSTGTLNFTITDVDSSVAQLAVNATSSVSSLVPDANIVISGAGTNRSLLITPAHDQSGSTMITITVSDGSLSSSQTFQLTVQAVNDPTVIALNSQPLILHVFAKKVTALDDAATISDVDTPVLTFAGSVLEVSGQSVKDKISILKQAGISHKGKKVLLGKTIIGTVSGGLKGAPLSVVLNGAATQNSVQTLLRSLGFNSADKIPGTRTLRMQITNIGGARTNEATRQIQLEP
ncbi:MAG: hypothetical protein JWM11_1428, partial [Planctomycetaceae bacterium]|nr:hypothetical protein [Planctomycetaceae bacterium]